MIDLLQDRLTQLKMEILKGRELEDDLTAQKAAIEDRLTDVSQTLRNLEGAVAVTEEYLIAVRHQAPD